jgi:predicted DNA-binding transcriptional regulator AlpA
MRIIDKRETARKCGNVHHSTLVRWANEPRFQHLRFPRPVQVSDGRVGWLESEIDEWIASRPRITAREVA